MRSTATSVALVSSDASARTDDPMARVFDEAVHLFHRSIQCVSAGNSARAVQYYAAAFMADELSISLTEAPVGAVETEATDPAEGSLRGKAMPMSMLTTLAEHCKTNCDTDVDLVEDKLLLLSLSSLSRQNGDLIKEILGLDDELMLRLSRDVLAKVSEKPDLYERNVAACAGYLTLAKARCLHSQHLHQAGYRDMARTEATKALELEPRNAKLRMQLVDTYIDGHHHRDDAGGDGRQQYPGRAQMLVRHLNRAITDSHRDSRYRTLIYSTLSELRIFHPDIATWEEVESTIIKMKQARERSIEIYGSCPSSAGSNNRSVAYERVCRTYERFLDDPDLLLNRRAMDKASGRKATANYTLEQVSCYACGAEEGEGIMLKACGLCEEALYCTKECQQKDWGHHSRICVKAKSGTGPAQWPKRRMCGVQQGILHTLELTY